MTDRHAGYVVTLSEDVREDDAEAIINAIRMIRGVVDVAPVLGGVDMQIAEARVNGRWRDRIAGLLREETDTRRTA
jgi:hypothetical protein